MQIVRRMKLHDPSYPGERSSQRWLYRSAFSMPRTLLHRAHTSSSIPWCMWLADVLQALHFEAPSNFSSCELWTNLPSSQHEFQRIYKALLQQETDTLEQQTPLWLGLSSQEDAILLLVAILSDSICLRRSLGQMALHVDPLDGFLHHRNPFLPLAPHTELERMQRSLSGALDRWQRQFHEAATPEIVALYHYCRLHLSCPKLPCLSQIAGYRPMIPNASSHKPSTLRLAVEVSEESVSHSWLVLDSAASRGKPSGSLCPAWLPIVVFHASLVVWAKLHNTETSKGDTYSSTRVLLAFKAELSEMEWPCCVEMALTLDELMSKPTYSIAR